MHAFALVCGAVAALIGAAALATVLRYAAAPSTLQWLAGIPPATAAGLLLGGAALALAGIPATRVRGLVRASRAALGTALAALGAAGFIVRFLPLGELQDGLEASTASGLAMSVPTASAFVLLGAAALAELGVGTLSRRAAGLFAAAAAIVGLLAMTGHLYGVPLLYGPLEAPYMALTTAVAIVLLALGIIALRPQDGLTGVAQRRTVLGAQVRWLYPVAVLMPLVAGGVALGLYELLAMPRLAIAIGAVGTAVGMASSIAGAALRHRPIESKLDIASRALARAGQGVIIGDNMHASGDVPIVYANDAFAAISGYSIDEAAGRPFDFLAAGEPRDAEAVADIASSLEDGCRRTVLFQARRKDGSLFSCRMTVSGVPGVGGRNDHTVALLEDVTAEQLAAKARLELLAEASQARKDAEAAARARDELLASITHDLRSPLNASLMWTDVVALSPLSDKAVKAVDAIKRNLKLQARLVSDLIDTAKLASGGVELYLGRGDVADLINRNLSSWRSMARAVGVTFRFTLEDADYAVTIDEDRILQVLQDLIDFSVHSTRSGSAVDLELGTDASGVLIRIRCDRGDLSDEDIERTFAPYWGARGIKSDKRRRLGIGLGLSIAQHIVDRHEGSLTAETENAGEDFVFHVWLPRSNERASPPNEQVAR